MQAYPNIFGFGTPNQLLQIISYLLGYSLLLVVSYAILLMCGWLPCNQHDTSGNLTNSTSKQTLFGEYLSIATLIFDIYQYCNYVSIIPLVHLQNMIIKKTSLQILIKHLWANVPASKWHLLLLRRTLQKWLKIKCCHIYTSSPRKDDER